MRDLGCVQEGRLFEHRKNLPCGSVFEALYIDDHGVVAIVLDKRNLRESSGTDADIIRASHRAYEHAGLPISSSKAFGFSRKPDDGSPATADANFTLWGTLIENEPGLASAPWHKKGSDYLL